MAKQIAWKEHRDVLLRFLEGKVKAKEALESIGLPPTEANTNKFYSAARDVKLRKGGQNPKARRTAAKTPADVVLIRQNEEQYAFVASAGRIKLVSGLELYRRVGL